MSNPSTTAFALLTSPAFADLVKAGHYKHLADAAAETLLCDLKPVVGVACFQTEAAALPPPLKSPHAADSPARVEVATEATPADPPKKRVGRPPKAEAAQVSAEPVITVTATVDDIMPTEVKTTPRPAVASKPVTPPKAPLDAKAAIMQLAARDHKTAVAILAKFGARKLSEVPADKLADCTAQIIAALDAIAASSVVE